MPTVDEIKAAAEVLAALHDERAFREIPDYYTTFDLTSKQLRELANIRAPKSRKIFVQEWSNDDSKDVIVYIERHDGRFVGAYVGEAWGGVTVNESMRADMPTGEQVWGPTE